MSERVGWVKRKSGFKGGLGNILTVFEDDPELEWE